MVFRLSPPNIQFCDANGVPLAGGFLYFYVTETSTPQNTYQDSGLTTPNANPITLDSGGYAGNIFLIQGAQYKVVLTNSNGVQQWTIDPVSDPTSAGGTFNNFIAVNGASGSARSVILETNGSPRFEMTADAALESGGNAGSDFQLNSFDDTGVLLQNIFTVSRATGAVTFGTGVMFLTAPTIPVGVNEQTVVSYTILASDQNKLVTRSFATAISDTLPQAVGAFGVGFSFEYQNSGPGVLVLTPTISTINGAASLFLPPGTGVGIYSDGANWQVSGNVPTQQGRFLLNTLMASNSATLSDLTSFLLPFSEFELIFENIVPASASVALGLQVYSGAAYQTTSYLTLALRSNAGGTANSNPSTFVPIGSGLSEALNAAPGTSGNMIVSNPAQTSAKKMFTGTFGTYLTGGAEVSFVSGWWNGGNGALTGFQIFESSGNITSGVVKIYGSN